MKCIPAQSFGRNGNPYYVDHGLKGHTGLDVVCGYGSDIHADYDMQVYKIFTKESHGSDGFTGIFALYDDGLQSFEWCIGHCKNVNVKIGDKVTTGDLIGTEGNFGLVWSGNQQITFAMSSAGDTRGYHRHYQMRPYKKVKRTSWGNQYLSTTTGIYLDSDNNYYEIINFNNGYNGCIDFSQKLFQRNLTVGMSGYDVLVLQRIFKKEQLFTVEPTGFFGPVTLAAAVKYQKAHSIAPTYGYVGPITRTLLETNIVKPLAEAAIEWQLLHLR